MFRQHSVMGGRSVRTVVTNHTSTFKAGVLQPVSCDHFMQGEGGMVHREVSLELAPIAGRLASEVSVCINAVWVPLLAADLQHNEDNWQRGNAEYVREQLLQGTELFGLVSPNEITNSMGIQPIKIDGNKRVSHAVMFAHAAAVNFLRQQKYIKADQITYSVTKPTPALLSSTVLQRFGGVLKPDDRINGAVVIGGNAPVKGIGLAHFGSGPVNEEGGNIREGDGEPARNLDNGSWLIRDVHGTGTAQLIVEQDPDQDNHPYIRAEFGGNDGAIRLSDLYNAERIDAFTRTIRQVIDERPELGEIVVQRMIHGLSVESGKECEMAYDRTFPLNRSMAYGMDSVAIEQDVSRTDVSASVSFSVPIPESEFGGYLLTFVSVKPDEVISSQPHPTLTEPVRSHNFAADQFRIGPERVTLRQLDGDCDPALEGKTAFWVGPNHVKRNYVNYGFTPNVDETTVENKTAIWQYEVPTSVTPSNVIYDPDLLDFYPFADQLADHVTCSVSSMASISTPLHFGPTPVEALEALQNADLKGDLIDAE